jgi:hypothetical protein
MTTPHKLHIKIGHVEFNAEGSEATVNEQYKKFLEVVAAVGLSQANEPPPGADNGFARQDVPALPQAPSAAEMQRVFSEDGEGVISLRLLPKTDSRAADAVVMILYGFRALKSQIDVPAADLIQGLRQSGISLDRIDRVLAPYDQYVQRGGTKRGSRYALTNPGVSHAEKLVSEMFG